MILFTRKISEFLIKILVKDSDYLKIWISSNVNHGWLRCRSWNAPCNKENHNEKHWKSSKWSTKIPILTFVCPSHFGNTSAQGGCCNVLKFLLLNALYPCIYYQCLAFMGLLFSLLPKQVPTIFVRVIIMIMLACPWKWAIFWTGIKK